MIKTIEEENDFINEILPINPVVCINENSINEGCESFFETSTDIHNMLRGLQGGTQDQYYHVTKNILDALNGATTPSALNKFITAIDLQDLTPVGNEITASNGLKKVGDNISINSSFYDPVLGTVRYFTSKQDVFDNIIGEQRRGEFTILIKTDIVLVSGYPLDFYLPLVVTVVGGLVYVDGEELAPENQAQLEVTQKTEIIEWWFLGGIAEENFVIKNPDQDLSDYVPYDANVIIKAGYPYIDPDNNLLLHISGSTVWKIYGRRYQTGSVDFNIIPTTNGYKRIDLLYLNTNNEILLFQGQESLTVAVEPYLYQIPGNQSGILKFIPIYIADNNVSVSEYDFQRYYTKKESDGKYIFNNPFTKQAGNININGTVKALNFSGYSLGLVGPDNLGFITSYIDENQGAGQGGTAAALNFIADGKQMQLRYQPGSDTGEQRIGVRLPNNGNYVLGYLSDITSGLNNVYFNSLKIKQEPSSPVGEYDVLTRDRLTGIVTKITLPESTVVTPVTASNGLTKDGNGNITLGGTLTQPTSLVNGDSQSISRTVVYINNDAIVLAKIVNNNIQQINFGTDDQLSVIDGINGKGFIYAGDYSIGRTFPADNNWIPNAKFVLDKIAAIQGVDISGKVDKIVGKSLSTNDYTTLEKNKLAAILGTNTGDQDLSGKVDKVTNKSLILDSEITRLAGVTNQVIPPTPNLTQVLTAGNGANINLIISTGPKGTEIQSGAISFKSVSGTTIVGTNAIVTDASYTGNFTSLLRSKTGTLALLEDAATDVETQILTGVVEDYKTVTRSKLFNWWDWAKTQLITFTNTITLGVGTAIKPALKLPKGVLLTSPQNGVIERDSVGNLWSTRNDGRYRLVEDDGFLIFLAYSQKVDENSTTGRVSVVTTTTSPFSQIGRFPNSATLRLNTIDLLLAGEDGVNFGGTELFTSVKYETFLKINNGTFSTTYDGSSGLSSKIKLIEYLGPKVGQKSYITPFITDVQDPNLTLAQWSKISYVQHSISETDILTATPKEYFLRDSANTRPFGAAECEFSFEQVVTVVYADATNANGNNLNRVVRSTNASVFVEKIFVKIN